MVLYPKPKKNFKGKQQNPT